MGWARTSSHFFKELQNQNGVPTLRSDVDSNPFEPFELGGLKPGTFYIRKGFL
jgi:hypothetical protein